MTKFDSVIPSGSEGKVYASVDISHFKGNLDKSVDVETNDPLQPRSRLSIKGIIKTYLDVRPADQVSFTVSKGKTESKELTIMPTYEKPLKLLAPKVSNPDTFDAKLDPPAAGQTEYKLTVSVKSTAKVGSQRGAVTIPVAGDVIPPQEITVFAMVRGAIAANPSLISFMIKTFPEEISATQTASLYQQPDETTPVVTTSEPGEPLKVIGRKDAWYQVISGGAPQTAMKPGQPMAQRLGWVKRSDVKTTRESGFPGPQTITIQKNSGNFKVLDYVCTLPNIKLELQPKEGEANTFLLKASLANPEQVKKNEAPGTIVVKTNDPEQPEVRVPVYVIVS